MTNTIFKPKTLDGRDYWIAEDHLSAGELNRIESNIESIYKILTALGYGIPSLENKSDWNINKIPTRVDVQRITLNIAEIARNYFTPNEYESLLKIADPNKSFLDYEDVNIWEKCLRWLCEQYETGRQYNTHGDLKHWGFTHGELAEFTHLQIKTDSSIKPIRGITVNDSPDDPIDEPPDEPIVEPPDEPDDPPPSGISITPENLEAEFRISSSWGGDNGSDYFVQYNLFLTNTGNTTIREWKVIIDLLNGVQFVSGGNGATVSGSTITIAPDLSWNREYPPNQTIGTDAYFIIRGPVREDLIL